LFFCLLHVAQGLSHLKMDHSLRNAVPTFSAAKFRKLIYLWKYILLKTTDSYPFSVKVGVLKLSASSSLAFPSFMKPFFSQSKTSNYSRSIPSNFFLPSLSKFLSSSILIYSLSSSPPPRYVVFSLLRCFV
jgi:hypothetical protein